jgi:1-deoxy-D-xylulose-5-phosphate reductoisomerase
MVQKKGIAVLGSTGHLGSQVLEVLSNHPSLFDIQVLSGYTQTQRLIEQAKVFQPNIVVVVDEDAYQTVSEALREEDIHVYAGPNALSQVVQGNDIHIVVNAIAGIEALPPCISAIEAKKNIVLGNTEILCVAGELIQSLVVKYNTQMLPIDPCLSGMFQGISGEYQNIIERVYIPAALEENYSVQCNTGWTMMQARWLFNLRPDQIDCLLHNQNMIVSLVQFEDGQMKAQWVNADATVTIQYALTYPNRVAHNGTRFNFLNGRSLELERPELPRFPILQLVYDALDAGGTMPCALYASNTVTLGALKKNQITQEEWISINEKVMHAVYSSGMKEFDEIQDTYRQATQMAIDLCSR